MTTTADIRKKYLQIGQFMPSVAEDINALCDKVDHLERLLRAVEYDNYEIYIDEAEVWFDARNQILGELS